MHSLTSPTRLRAAQRRSDALQLRLLGRTCAEIGRVLGCSPQRAHAILKEEMTRLHAERKERADAILADMLGHLDTLHQSFFPKALRGDDRALDCMLKIMERRARLLGLDLSRRVQVNARNDFEEMTLEELRTEARRLGIPVGTDRESVPGATLQ